MTLDLRREGDLCHATLLESRLDALCSTAVREALLEAVRQGARRIVLDLSRTGFVDSSGLGALVAVLRRLPAPGSLVLRGTGEPVERALRLARLDRILVIEGAGAPRPA